MEPSPFYKEVLAVGDVTLSWNNIDPNTSTFVDVWFGTDPNKLNPGTYTRALEDVDVTGQARSFVIVSAPDEGTYYWQVDTYSGGELIEGDVFAFSAIEDLPPLVHIETPDTLTWAGQPVQLDATIIDDGMSSVEIVWSAGDADPNIMFSPSPYVEDPIVTGDSHQPHTTITVTVSDGSPLGEVDSDSMVLDIAADACQAARGGFLRLDRVYRADFDGNCIVDLEDFSELVWQWLDDYAMAGPLPIDDE